MGKRKRGKEEKRKTKRGHTAELYSMYANPRDFPRALV